jgi:hypothetical protein
MYCVTQEFYLVNLETERDLETERANANIGTIDFCATNAKVLAFDTKAS